MAPTQTEVKKVAELTREEAMAELVAHRTAGINVPEFTPEANVTALRRLVTIARKDAAALVPEVTPTTEETTPAVTPETTPEVPETPGIAPVVTPEAPVVPEPAPVVKPETSTKTAPVALDFQLVEGPIRVTPTDGAPERVYSFQSHGSVYKTLAQNYAEAHKGKLSK